MVCKIQSHAKNRLSNYNMYRTYLAERTAGGFKIDKNVLKIVKKNKKNNKKYRIIWINKNRKKRLLRIE